MKKFTLPAAVLRAATVCLAKRDVRYYLGGIHVNNERVTGTNGHVAFVNFTEKWADEFKNEFPDDGLILDIEGTIPVKAHYSEFTLTSEAIGICEFKDHKFELVRRCVFTLIDGKYPNVDKILPKGKRERVLEIGFNTEYLSAIHKTFSCLSKRWTNVKLNFYGDHSGAVAINENSDYGKSMFIVMPMRL